MYASGSGLCRAAAVCPSGLRFLYYPLALLVRSTFEHPSTR